MSSFVVAGRIWDSKGNVRETLSVRPETFGLASSLLDDVLGRIAPRLATALGGETVTVSEEAGGHALECILLPLCDREGKIDGAVSLVFDVTERNRIEAALHARLSFEKLITELSSQFIHLAPEDVDRAINDALGAIGTFAAVDRAYIFLFSKDGASVSNTHKWCAPGIPPQVEDLGERPVGMFPWLTARMRRREAIHVERVSMLPDEAAAERGILLRQAIKSAVVVPMACGTGVVGFLGFDSVRTEKSWAREDIVLLRIVGEIFVNALDRKQREVERKLLEAQLVQTRSLENVAKLAGGVAHDFNNLLGVILNYSAMLKRELSDPRHVAYLHELHESARQAAHLTRQLLMVGRRGVIEPIALDLNEAITTLVDLLRGALGEHVELNFELEKDIGIIRVGIPQIEQVILNLTMNARDAMPHGGSFTLRTETVELDEAYAAQFIDLSPGRYTLLTASDTGVGMTPEVASRALEPFFTTKGSFGSGLGLSTVHGIVKQAGGHLVLATAPSAGCTIRMFFPVVEDVVPVRPPAPVAAPPPRGSGETVLVVEDSPSVRKLVVGQLIEHGYRVLDAGTPAQALQIVRQQERPVDLLLSDVILPQMSGLALADLTREKVRRVLFMSGYEDNLIARQGVLNEGIRLLQKPFTEEELLRGVRSSLDS